MLVNLINVLLSSADTGGAWKGQKKIAVAYTLMSIFAVSRCLKRCRFLSALFFYANAARNAAWARFDGYTLNSEACSTCSVRFSGILTFVPPQSRTITLGQEVVENGRG